ncbi:MAG: hypothetical protein RR645_01625, partial [Clostridium sp.]
MRINKSIKIFMTIGIVLLPLILSSCWDKKEINERAFVNTLYIDKNYARIQSEFISSDLKKRDDERLFVSFGIANASEGETRLTTFVHSATGVSLGNIVEKLNGEITRTPFFGHTKLIVLGKGLLGEPELLSMVLDGLEREMSIGRELKIIASESSNVTLEDLRPNIETLYSSYIVGVMEQSDSISYTIPMNMGEFFNDIRKGDG